MSVPFFIYAAATLNGMLMVCCVEWDISVFFIV